MSFVSSFVCNLAQNQWNRNKLPTTLRCTHPELCKGSADSVTTVPTVRRLEDAQEFFKVNATRQIGVNSRENALDVPSVLRDACRARGVNDRQGTEEREKPTRPVESRGSDNSGTDISPDPSPSMKSNQRRSSYGITKPIHTRARSWASASAHRPFVAG